MVEELRLQFDVPVPPDVIVKMVGAQVAVRPVAGDTDLERVRVPVNPLRLVRVTVDVPDVPDGNVRVDGLVMMLKSGGAITLTEIVTVCASEPLAPVIVTV